MIVIDGLDTTASTANTDSYATNTLEPLPNGLLIAFVSAAGTVLVGSMSGGGLTWVSQGSDVQDTLRIVNCFTAQCGASPGSFVATFTCTGDAATGCIIEVIHVTGHKASAPIRQIKFAEGNDFPAFTMDAPFLEKNGYLSYAALQDIPPLPTLDGWSLLNTGTHITPARAALTYGLVNGLTNQDVIWTAEEAYASRWHGFTLELSPAAGVHSLASMGAGK